MKVSIVITAYNRPEIFYRTLYSLHKQKDADSEILVSIDDDPEVYPITEQICKDFIAQGCNLKYFNTAKYKRGVGWSLNTYPCNVGIRQATGEIVMLCLDDVMSINNTIELHRQAHIKASGERAVFSTVHAVTHELQKNIDTYDWKNNPQSLLFKGSCYKMFSGIGKSYTTMYEYEDAATPYYWQMSVRKKHFEEIRGLDEDYYGNIGGCADDDLADRLGRKGVRFYFSPDAIAIHQLHADSTHVAKHFEELCPPNYNGHMLFKERSKMGIVRNAKHEWGEYPRNMEKLPPISGVL